MKTQVPVSDRKDHDRITAGVPFVEAMARRMAATLPHSIDLGDLVQDGMIGLIDAAHRFEEAARHQVRDVRRTARPGGDDRRHAPRCWPRGVRKVRRELEAAREKLRHELGAEPSLADLAKHMGSDAARLSRTIVRIKTIESTSPLASNDAAHNATLPPVMSPAELPGPDRVCERDDVANRVREAIKALPARERKVIGLYYYGDVTMKEIGGEIGVNESRVSQLHARAVQRLRKELGPDLSPEPMAASVTAGATPVGRGRRRLNMAKARLPMAARRTSAA